jgi:small-conductance mechanosensitive channel
MAVRHYRPQQREVPYMIDVSVDWLVHKPLRIVLIVVVAFVVRLIAHRLIRRLTLETPRRRSWLGRMVRGRVRERVAPATSERRLQRARTIGSLLRSVVSVTVWGTAFVLVLTELGLNPAPLIASAGVVGLAIGFGAQNLVRDFLSGMFMMLEDQYGVGDVIDVGEASGTVEAVGLRVTTLRDINGTVWYVRNGEVLRVGNSSQGHAVAVVDLPVGHNADTGEVIELLARRAVAAVAEEPLVSDVLAPPEVLGVEQVTAEGLMLRTTVQVRAGRQWAVQRQLRAQLKEALDEAGVEPPYGPAAPPSRGQ